MDWILLLLLAILCLLIYSVGLQLNAISTNLEKYNTASDLKVLVDLCRRQCESLEMLADKVDNIEANLATFGSTTPPYKRPALNVEGEDLSEIRATLSEIASSVGRVEDIANQLAVREP